MTRHGLKRKNQKQLPRVSFLTASLWAQLKIQASIPLKQMTHDCLVLLLLGNTDFFVSGKSSNLLILLFTYLTARLVIYTTDGVFRWNRFTVCNSSP
jgi:hypothetical protein